MSQNGKRWASKEWPKRMQRCGLGTPTQRAVLVAMAIEGDYYGECCASRDRLAEVTSLSPLAVREAQIGLIEAGALVLISAGGGRGNPARYKLTGKKA